MKVYSFNFPGGAVRNVFLAERMYERAVAEKYLMEIEPNVYTDDGDWESWEGFRMAMDLVKVVVNNHETFLKPV